MRHGFTLIELMIVIAIIAIIAAIAIPNLLESRVTSQESSAAAALKSGLLPGEVQFQSGGYSDADGNGIGTYCVVGASNVGTVSATAGPYSCLSGQTTISGITLNLLAPTYAGGTPTISGYMFKSPIADISPTATLDYNAERVWAVVCFPADDNQGRRFFGINQAGNVYSSKPAQTANSGALNVGGAATPANTDNLFGASLSSTPNTANYLPYRK